MDRSFIKNRKEQKERNILLKRTDAQPWGEYNIIIFWTIVITRKRVGRAGTRMDSLTYFISIMQGGNSIFRSFDLQSFDLRSLDIFDL